MQDSGDFDAYCRAYLEQWEKRATVRRRERTRLSEDALQGEMYPSSMAFLLKHESVVALGPEAARRLLLRYACDFLEHVAILEVRVIGDLCSKLANYGMDVPVPYSAKQVALTVATDEAYHAYVAREFLDDAARLAGVVPAEAADIDLSILSALAAVQREAPAHLMRAAETLVLCFAENFVTEELFGLSREADPTGLFHILMREHMMDEGRHQLFFQNLFRHLWRNLDDADRILLGRLVVTLLEILLSAGFESFGRGQITVLTWLGFDEAAAEKIFSEATAVEFGTTPMPAKHKMKMMQNIMNLVEVSGVLDHPPTRAAMVEKGWADA